MPIRKVSGGYKWGGHGHVYPTRAGAERQAAAAHANGFRGDSSGGATLDDILEECKRFDASRADGGNFAHLERKFAQKKGIRNPRGLAAKVEREQIGEKEMTRRSVAARQH